ncbi:ARM repeat-containing protein [Calocera viscosa TUFC12733]|uniref:ARM repeat-containing protein n=1 Tax=Calocera viscosa (strain TUFC12733) TaxID=1330018 RepID=A0A167QSD0_CALVF|nr:ARM repeat-containing protein [Calocera viscosa TUFC12733]
MEPAVVKGLNDKFYEKRKGAALELEKAVRDAQAHNDTAKIHQIVDQLCDLFASSSNPLHSRNGGLIGLAATSIALGVEVAPHLETIVPPVLACFTDPESRIRYFACESMYNIAKVSKGEILIFFNEIFDALSKLAADSETSVRNGAELLDRLLKDIVAESGPTYVPHFPETEKIRREKQSDSLNGLGIAAASKESDEAVENSALPKQAFSLARFIPLLSERIYVISPLTRSYLVSWITVLDSVPDLELVSYLPEFLDGLLKYLSDPTEDVKIATENVLADFLKEIRQIAQVQAQRERERLRKLEKVKAKKAAAEARGSQSDEPVTPPARTNGESGSCAFEDEEDLVDDQGRGSGAWIPGQNVAVDHAAIVEILIAQLDSDHDEIQQSTALRWLTEFLSFAKEVMVPFTPRLILAVLPNLAHHVPTIQAAAQTTNQQLFQVIQALPAPVVTPDVPTPQPPPAVLPPPQPAAAAAAQPPRAQSVASTRTAPASPTFDGTAFPSRASRDLHRDSLDITATPVPGRRQPTPSPVPSATHGPEPSAPLLADGNTPNKEAPGDVTPAAQLGSPALTDEMDDSPDPFDYQLTVNSLTVQFMSEHEETRVAALKWLLMLHSKAPKKILAMDDGTFPALLKTLSDPSEEVIKNDLRLLAQISSSSEEAYFKSFMVNLLELFSTDRRLLETRGSLIIRQLCLNLNSERIYRTFAEILERDEDLDFASTMVQKLNIILITSPELQEFRRRLKNLESKDGQMLFSILYKSWCHNAVAVFSLCLLAQAYEHASNLLQIFAELEITVHFLVQIDKLVQLIESPVFTSLRLQLLEPDRYPYLFKCLYGLLMLLPQSTAFISLRNRLNAVSALGFLHIAPKTSNVAAARSKLSRDEVKWQELLSHFRTVQMKHEKYRRQAAGGDVSPLAGLGLNSNGVSTGAAGGRGRRAAGAAKEPPPLTRENSGGRPAGVLSPLNPRARGSSGGQLAPLMSAFSGTPRATSPTAAAPAKRRGTLGGLRK